MNESVFFFFLSVLPFPSMGLKQALPSLPRLGRFLLGRVAREQHKRRVKAEAHREQK